MVGYEGYGNYGPVKKGPGKNGPAKTVQVITVLGKNGPGKRVQLKISLQINDSVAYWKY